MQDSNHSDQDEEMPDIICISTSMEFATHRPKVHIVTHENKKMQTGK